MIKQYIPDLTIKVQYLQKGILPLKIFHFVEPGFLFHPEISDYN